MSTLDSASASVHRELGVGKVANGDEEDAATEDDDAALEDEGEAENAEQGEEADPDCESHFVDSLTVSY